MFMPDSTISDLAQNFDFLMKNKLLDRLDRTANLLSHRQIVLMNTSGYTRYEAEERLTKTGPFGFEGEVSYIDQKVKLISDIVIHACLLVLKDMAKSDSTIYWRNCKESLIAKKVNDYLVCLFERLLKKANKNLSLPSVDDEIAIIEKELSEILNKNAVLEIIE